MADDQAMTGSVQLWAGFSVHLILCRIVWSHNALVLIHRRLSHQSSSTVTPSSVLLFRCYHRLGLARSLHQYNAFITREGRSIVFCGKTGLQVLGTVGKRQTNF